MVSDEFFVIVAAWCNTFEGVHPQLLVKVWHHQLAVVGVLAYVWIRAGNFECMTTPYGDQESLDVGASVCVRVCVRLVTCYTDSL